MFYRLFFLSHISQIMYILPKPLSTEAVLFLAERHVAAYYNALY